MAARTEKWTLRLRYPPDSTKKIVFRDAPPPDSLAGFLDLVSARIPSLATGLARGDYRVTYLDDDGVTPLDLEDNEDYVTMREAWSDRLGDREMVVCAAIDMDRMQTQRTTPPPLELSAMSLTGGRSFGWAAPITPAELLSQGSHAVEFSDSTLFGRAPTPAGGGLGGGGSTRSGSLLLLPDAMLPLPESGALSVLGQAEARDGARGGGTSAASVPVNIPLVAAQGYTPMREDELAVSPGDTLVVATRFQDRWAVARNLTSGCEGTIPASFVLRDREGNVSMSDAPTAHTSVTSDHHTPTPTTRPAMIRRFSWEESISAPTLARQPTSITSTATPTSPPVTPIFIPTPTGSPLTFIPGGGGGIAGTGLGISSGIGMGMGGAGAGAGSTVGSPANPADFYASPRTSTSSSVPTATPRVERARITLLDGAVHTFPFMWRHERHNGVEELMGALWGPAWSGQREWRYEQYGLEPKDWMLKYVPRNSDFRSSNLGYVQFTIFFNDDLLFTSAARHLPSTLPNLHPSTFFRHLVDRLRLSRSTRDVRTEWACIEPPYSYSGPPSGVGDFHVAYVVRAAGDALSERCGASVRNWIGNALTRGDWAKAKRYPDFRVPR